MNYFDNMIELVEEMEDSMKSVLERKGLEYPKEDYEVNRYSSFAMNLTILQGKLNNLSEAISMIK